MKSSVGVDFGHDGNIRARSRPSPETPAWDNRDVTWICRQQYVLSAERGPVAEVWRVTRHSQVVAVRCRVDHVHLQKVLDAVQPLEDELVPGIQLDSWLSVYAFSAQFSTKLALRLRSIAPRFP